MFVGRSYGGRVAAALLMLLLGSISTTPVAADFVLTSHYGVRRFTDNGTLVYDRAPLGEDVAGMALGTNGIIYAIDQQLGQAGVLRLFTNGQFVDPQPFPPDPQNFFATFNSAYGQLEHGPAGDLFALRLGPAPPNFYAEEDVLRINGVTGALGPILDGAIPPAPHGPQLPTSHFRDLEAKGDELFVANANGTIQRHLITASDETLVDTLDTGINDVRWIAFGPDGLLYLREGVNNSIIRYNIDTKMIVDTFVSNVPLTNTVVGDPSSLVIGDIFFGPNGDLFAINGSGRLADQITYTNGHLVRFDGQTGTYLGQQFSVPALGNGFSTLPGLTSFGFYLAAPEPVTLALALPCIVCLCARRGRRRRRAN